MPNLATQIETRQTYSHSHMCSLWLLWRQPELQHKTANHNCPLAANHNVAYAHSSVQPMILCDVISRRRSPSRSGNHTGIIYDSSFRDGEVLFCLNKLLSAQWNCLLTLSNSVQDKCWHGNNMIIITESDFPYLVKYDDKFTKFCVLFRGGN